MNPTFVDTSAIFALANPSDGNHAAATTWLDAVGDRGELVTHDWILVEATALMHGRSGPSQGRLLAAWILDNIRVATVTPLLRAAAFDQYLREPAAVSLVDATSFEFMRSIGCDTAFAFDRHFARPGIRLVP